MDKESLFNKLQKINQRPKPYEFYTTPELWTEAYVATQMLKYHLDPSEELASRNQAFITRSIEWITTYFSLYNNKSVCDFGCGPGIYTTEFAKSGAKVTGIDISQISINHAKKIATDEKLDIKYICENYLNFKTKNTFDLITMIYCDFSVLSPEQRKFLLQTFYNSLNKDGQILLDVFSIKLFEDTQEKKTYDYTEKKGFWSDNPCYSFLNTFKYPENNLLLDKWSIFEQNRTRVIYNWMQCYTLESITQEFKACGFDIETHYANVAGDNYNIEENEIAIIARKKH